MTNIAKWVGALGLAVAFSDSVFAGTVPDDKGYITPQLMAYRSFLPELEETARFAKLGIKTRTIFIANTISANGRPYCQYAPVWKGVGLYDYAPVDEQLGDILKVSPDADFIIMLDLNTPMWFARHLHHDSYEELTHVAVMDGWRTESRRYLDGLVRYIEKGYGDRVRAYVLMCGQTSEWFENSPRQSREKNEAWRKWCKERGFDYGLSTPDEGELAEGAFEGTIYDPATEKRKIDYWRFHCGIISDAVLDFAHVTKLASNGKPVSADYGYYMICNLNTTLSGSLDYERVLASPDIDFLTSPATYSGREIGGGVGSMLVMATSRRYGKRCLYSIDAWPHSKERPKSLVTCIAPPKYYKTLEDTLAGNTRSAAFALVHHTNFHWFDQWGGFYHDPGVRERIAKIGEIQRRFADDASAPLADVMIVADPESAYERVSPDVTFAEGCGKTPEGFMPFLGCGEHFRNIINRSGVVYDICSLNDLPHLDLSRIKAFVLADTWQITPDKEKILREQVFQPGRTALWVYAPGVSDGKSVDAARVEKWAGVPFKAKGVNTVRREGGWTSVYAYDYRDLNAQRLREVLMAAGCHAWTEELVPVVANDHLFSVHFKAGGRKRISLPFKCRMVIDLLKDEVVARETDSFEAEYASPDTAIYEMVRDLGTAGWEDAPEPRRDFPETKVVWRFADTDHRRCRVEKRNGAEGTVEITDGAIKIEKTNAAGEIVIFPEPFQTEKGLQLAFAADVAVDGTDWSRSQGKIRAFGEKESFEVSPLDSEDGRWGNRCLMWELPNSRPGTTYRKYTQHVSEGKVQPVIIIAGDPSKSVWKNFLAEDRQAQRAAWCREVERRNAKNRFRETQMAEAEFDAMLAKDVEHTAKIVTENGVSTLLVDGRRTVPLVYRGKHSLLGTSQTELFFGRRLQDQGLKLQIVDVRFGPCGGDMGFWTKDGFDLQGMVKDVKDAMRVSPDSVFLLALGCTVYPEFVEVENPGEVWVTKDGAKAVGHGSSAIKYVDKSINAGNRKWEWPSMASRKYREGISARIRELVAELKRQHLAKRVVGIHTFGYHDAQFTVALSDHSPHAKAEYAIYCQEPGHASYNYEFFVRQLGFRAQEEFARVFKEALGKESIAVMWWESPLRGRPASSWDLGSFLRSKWMDVIVAQPWYEHRAPAVIGASHPPFASMHLHGKMFWDELDLRNYEIIETFRKGPAAIPGGGVGADFTQWQTMFRKLSGVMLANRMGNWFYEKAGGAFSTPTISADIGDEYRLWQRVQQLPFKAWKPSVAVIADEAGVWGWPEAEKFNEQHVERGYFDQMPLLEASGVPFDIYLLEDILRQPELLNDYRLAVFAHLRVIDEARQQLLAALGSRGLKLAFLSGAGEVRGAELLPEKPYPELGLSAAEFNRRARAAGGYVPIEPNAAQVDMNGNFIALHALKNGRFEFQLPFPAKVTNLKSNLPETVTDGKLVLQLTAGETCRFALESK